VEVAGLERWGRSGWAYGETPAAQVLEILHVGSKTSVVVVLPKEGKDLDAVLASERSHEWTASLAPTSAIVRIPKFRLSTRRDLAGVLAGLGMPRAFSERDAELSRFALPSGSSLSGVVHQTVLEVSETGTRAATATAVVVTRGGDSDATDEGPEFTADRPFLVLVRHRATGAVLFAGIVRDPTRE
jgi:serpin B